MVQPSNISDLSTIISVFVQAIPLEYVSRSNRLHHWSVQIAVLSSVFVVLWSSSGIAGQDGMYLTEHLLSLGYTVHGVIRHSSKSQSIHLEAIRRSEFHRPDPWISKI